MSINSLESLEMYQRIFMSGVSASKASGTGTTQTAQNSGYMPKDSTEISAFGQFMTSLVSEFGDSETGQEIQSFFQESIRAIKSGDTDAATAIEEAPEELKAFAEESGIDLAELLQGMASTSKVQRAMGPPPPPPPDMSNSTGMEELKTFFDSIKEAVTNDTFNPAEFAENVPEELQSFATEIGVSIEDLLTDIANKIGVKADSSET